ncbi:NAD(P)H-quinone oxidoreductase [Alteromonas sp. ASW11-36]|uniref:NAD(P)H-quinone oxidoreductase n=1 Tax=Alteromonas arenosi TaxID=3055817 RepID=A0ABT7SXY7_9ALTE|nr:NAD(P)H-quinone oxidoreductase [Alteromonas sp. ASW11-36]MDM7861054.1 NAD(P)H-quinone oxidoreductase [Alteromonas sp. ASW11-36]
MAKTMDYISVTGSGQLVLAQGERPNCTPNEVLIQVCAFGINRADTLQRQGKYPPPKGESTILGLEVSGTIVAVGNAVSNWQVGDEVCALLAGGGYAQYVNVDQGLLIPRIQRFSLAECAGLPEVFVTAYQALFALGKLEPGNKVLVHAGASGVGLAAIQLATAAKCEVAVTASNDEKLAICAENGAKHTINYTTSDFVDELKSSNFNPDVIVDFVGGDYLTRNLRILNTDGRIIYLAMLGGRYSEMDMALLLGKRATVQGSTLRNRSLEYKRKLVSDFWQRFGSGFDLGELTVNVYSLIAVTDIEQAHQRIESNQTHGKLIITWEH